MMANFSGTLIAPGMTRRMSVEIPKGPANDPDKPGQQVIIIAGVAFNDMTFEGEVEAVLLAAGEAGRKASDQSRPSAARCGNAKCRAR